MTPAVAYYRCSGVAAEFGDTFERQSAAVHQYAQAHDIEIVDEYRDAGVPGKTELQNRPGLAACLERVENNGVKLVLVEISDRLARDSIVSELIIRQFQKAGCKVISASGGVDLTEGDDSNPTAKLIRQILACVAEFDRCVTVLKLRAARERQRANGGRCEGRKGFGHRPGESETFGYIIKSYAEGMSPAAIANSLDALRIPTRMGKRWHAATVSKILKRVAT
jgi:DNA invertase Pin-like site-specific DNA recombinase